MHPVRIGCSGWSYNDWRGSLYPDGLPQRRWLERYAEVFDTVEVNATFYRLPKESTVQSWVEQVPGDFLFAVKASRYPTHMKRLHEIVDAVARFWETQHPTRTGTMRWPMRARAVPRARPRRRIVSSSSSTEYLTPALLTASSTASLRIGALSVSPYIWE